MALYDIHTGILYKDYDDSSPTYLTENDTSMAPTLSLVDNWLRKKKHIDITIVVDSHGFKYERYYVVSIINRNILVDLNNQRLLLHHPLMIMQRKLDVKIDILQTTIKI